MITDIALFCAGMVLGFLLHWAFAPSPAMPWPNPIDDPDREVLVNVEAIEGLIRGSFVAGCGIGVGEVIALLDHEVDRMAILQPDLEALAENRKWLAFMGARDVLEGLQSLGRGRRVRVILERVPQPAA